MAVPVLIYSLDLLATVGNAATGLIIMATGVYRIQSGGGKEILEEYGPAAYVIGVFALLITALFLGTLSVV